MHEEIKSAVDSDKVLGLPTDWQNFFPPCALQWVRKKIHLLQGGLCPLNSLHLYRLMISLQHTFGITFSEWWSDLKITPFHFTEMQICLRWRMTVNNTNIQKKNCRAVFGFCIKLALHVFWNQPVIGLAWLEKQWPQVMWQGKVGCVTREGWNTAGDTSSALASAWTCFKLKSSALSKMFVYLVSS